MKKNRDLNIEPEKGNQEMRNRVPNAMCEDECKYSKRTIMMKENLEEKQKIMVLNPAKETRYEMVDNCSLEVQVACMFGDPLTSPLPLHCRKSATKKIRELEFRTQNERPPENG
ncbi:unnamed protein product [Lathyrus sativus]|nr:unnamed protein product [Lathyrus sativus]